MAIVLGLNGKLYKNTNTYASPTWVLIPKVQDLELKIEGDQFDVSNRAGSGYKEVVNTLFDAEITFNMPYDPSDSILTGLQALARPGGSTIELLVLDGLVATSGSQGLRATCAIKTGTGRSEKLGEAMTVSFTAKPSPAANAASWFTV